METKANKNTPSSKSETKAKADTKKKDVADSKSDATQKTKTTSKDTKSDNSGQEFRELYTDELKDILWAEKALLKALPKMRKAATGKELAASFDEHMADAEKQIDTLNQVFELMGKKPATKKCDAMEGLLSEADSIISDTEKGTAIRDAGLILAAQKAKHYEIATYGTLAALADAMEEPKIAKLLRSILRSEKASDKELTVLAVESGNEYAAEE